MSLKTELYLKISALKFSDIKMLSKQLLCRNFNDTRQYFCIWTWISHKCQLQLLEIGNRCLVLRRLLNVETMSCIWTLVGRLEHELGPATANACFPSWNRVHGTKRSPCAADWHDSRQVTPEQACLECKMVQVHEAMVQTKFESHSSQSRVQWRRSLMKGVTLEDWLMDWGLTPDVLQ